MKIFYLSTFLIFSYSRVYSQCWKQISGGIDHSLGIKSDGSLWSWGNNGQGQLGNGTTSAETIPVRIGVEYNWLKVFAGATNSFAIKTDSTLWAWGNNSRGKLGIGGTINAYIPTPVGSQKWKYIFAGPNHTLGINQVQRMYSWGRNSNGQLGDSTLDDKYEPVQVHGNILWVKVSAGDLFSLGLDVNGKIHTFGSNGFGQLGLGVIGGSILIPTQINDSIWFDISAGSSHCLAIKIDNSLWAWGRNINGQLGINDDITRSIPTIVDRFGNGLEKDWSSINASGNTSLAIGSGYIFHSGNAIGTMLTNDVFAPILNTGNYIAVNGMTKLYSADIANNFWQILGFNSSEGVQPINCTCSPPLNLTVINVENISATVNWNVMNNQNYSIKYKLLSDENWVIADTNITSIPYSIINLLADTFYQWQVASVCEKLYYPGTNFKTCLSEVNCGTSIKLISKALLGGNYFYTGDTMNTTLHTMSLLPTKCPYDTTVVLNTLPAYMTDWIGIDLVDTLTGDTTYSSQCACLLKNGTIQNISGDTTLSFTGVSRSHISIRIKHRNHLSARSQGIANTPGVPISFDFRLGTNLYIDPTITGSAYNNIGQPEMLTSSGHYALWPGDTNGDGQIKYQGSGNDRGVILSAIGGIVITNTISGYYPTDINLNGQVKYQGSSNDRGIVLSSIGGSVITKITKAHE